MWFDAPSSFTGEDVAELHVHGSVAVVKAMLAALERLGNSGKAVQVEHIRLTLG